MKIIPAIDIQNGNCVRLRQGDFSQETIFHSEPIDIAEKWIKDGAERLHLVDLDGARLGSPINISIVSDICKKFPKIPIQIGGGIRDIQTAEKYLTAGARFIIIGTKAVEDPSFIKELCIKFPGKIIVGVDAKNGVVATEGWKSISNKNVIDLQCYPTRDVHGPAIPGSTPCAGLSIVDHRYRRSMAWKSASPDPE